MRLTRERFAAGGDLPRQLLDRALAIAGDRRGAVQQVLPAGVDAEDSVGQRKIRRRLEPVRDGARAACEARRALAPTAPARGPDARRAASGRCRPGASSTMTCALAPPTPNELRPARRGSSSGLPVDASARDVARAPAARCTSNGVSTNGICGFGSSEVIDGSSVRVLQLQQHLDQPEHAGARLEVADVRLDRPDACTRCSPVDRGVAQRGGRRRRASGRAPRSDRRARCRCRASRRR